MNKAKLITLLATYFIVISSTGGFFAFFYIVQNATTVEKAEAAQTSTSNFVVVGHYKDCDVVSWHGGALSDYHYFLHCENQPK